VIELILITGSPCVDRFFVLKLNETGLRESRESVQDVPANCMGVVNVFDVPLQIAWRS
jgi:hypothetical protein